MRTRVKICGITTLTDANKAVEAGADALGFIFVRDTPRYINPADAANIIHSIPPFITTVGVFKNTDSSLVYDIAEQTEISCIQLHGLETPDYCNQFSLPVIKVFELHEKFDFNTLNSFRVDAFLVDKPKSIQEGTANWELALRAKKHSNRLILAGGLTPENVAESILYVKPYAVDVSSGVESEIRIKDVKKINAFMREVTKTELVMNEK